MITNKRLTVRHVVQDEAERGDIYVVSLDPTEGHEQRGTRPVLVISPGKFNRLTQTPIILPITTGGDFARTAGFTVSLMGTGLNTQGVICCNQPRAIDLQARHGRKVERVPDAVLDEVLSKVQAILFD
jgi:mRNA interferase ChpB